VPSACQQLLPVCAHKVVTGHWLYVSVASMDLPAACSARGGKGGRQHAARAAHCAVQTSTLQQVSTSTGHACRWWAVCVLQGGEGNAVYVLMGIARAWGKNSTASEAFGRRVLTPRTADRALHQRILPTMPLAHLRQNPHAPPSAPTQCWCWCWCCCDSPMPTSH
jgi:hypothetical protein